MGLTTYEKQTLDTLKAINRNINYLGRKLEITNDILKKSGIAVMPTVETFGEEADKEPNYEKMVRLSDIEAWKENFYDTISVYQNLDEHTATLICDWINRMIDYLKQSSKVINIDIKEDK